MSNLLQTVACFVALAVVLELCFSLARAARRARLSKAASCRPIVKCQSKDPLFGLDTFVHLRKADAKGRLSEAYRELHDRYGPTFEINSLGTRQIQTSHPENIQTVCALAFEDWGVGPLRGGIGRPFIDRGIFTDDGAFWKHSRSLIRPTFARTEIADLANFEHHVKRFLKLIPADDSEFDLLPLVKRLFLDTSTEFLFGRSTETLLPETPFETDEFMKAFDRSLLGLAILLVFGRLRWPFYLDPWWRAAAKKVHKFVDKQVADILEDQRRPKTSEKENGETREKYVLLREMAKQQKDPYDLRMQAINAFFPARDTTAIAFADVMFHLARHPDVWEQLRDEVRALGDTPLTYEAVRSVNMVKCVINESLRLRPAASRIARAALKDTVLPKGGGPDGEDPIFVAQGTMIEMDLYSVQRDPAIWGDDAAEFRPSRWAKGRPLWEAKWQYEPFLGGIRMCPAQNMVITQASYLLIRFAQEFSTVKNVDPVKEYVERVAMTIESRNGVKVALTRAEA